MFGPVLQGRTVSQEQKMYIRMIAGSVGYFEIIILKTTPLGSAAMQS